MLVVVICLHLHPRQPNDPPPRLQLRDGGSFFCWNLNSEELSWRRKTRNCREYKTIETQLSLSVDGFYALCIFFIGIWALRLVLSYGHIAIFLIALLS